MSISIKSLAVVLICTATAPVFVSQARADDQADRQGQERPVVQFGDNPDPTYWQRLQERKAEQKAEERRDRIEAEQRRLDRIKAERDYERRKQDRINEERREAERLACCERRTRVTAAEAEERRKAAAAGDPIAQFELGQLLWSGEGAAMDRVRAEWLWRMSAGQRNSSAIIALATLVPSRPGATGDAADLAGRWSEGVCSNPWATMAINKLAADGTVTSCIITRPEGICAPEAGRRLTDYKDQGGRIEMTWDDGTRNIYHRLADGRLFTELVLVRGKMTTISNGRFSMEHRETPLLVHCPD